MTKRVDEPCVHIKKVVRDAEALGVTFTLNQTAEVGIHCATCGIYVLAYDNITTEVID